MRLEQAFSILDRLPEQNDGLIQLYTPGTKEVSGETLNFSASLESLRLKIDINSFDSLAIPAGLDELGTVEALETYKNYQWDSQRIHLKLMRRKGFGVWLEVGKIALLARPPFYVVDLMPYFTRQVALRIPPGDRIGIQIEDAGYGLLTDIDEVVIFGEGIEEVDYIAA